jgi:glutamyl-tRNA synthetase/glutamyl-Q tRNA(Asp) synthetase
VITRFAPAPTGYLHLGHVVNAHYVWGAARARRGRVLLRIEDHDRQRSRSAFETAILEDLAWLGFEADAPFVRQSDRDAVYRSALAPLVDRGLVYACSCTRAHILAAWPSRLSRGTLPAPRPSPSPSELFYPGTCRDRGLPLADGLGWRLRVEPTVERFEDDLCGPQEQHPSEQCGDLLLRDRLGNWTYQFAVTVDDMVQEVTDVIRGMDLLASTGRQLLLARHLGRAAPARFAHHPLVMKSPTEKMSKSAGDAGVGELRRLGLSPADVIEKAMAALRHGVR